MLNVVGSKDLLLCIIFPLYLKRSLISYEILSFSIKCFTVLQKYGYYCFIKKYIGAFFIARFVNG